MSIRGAHAGSGRVAAGFVLLAGLLGCGRPDVPGTPGTRLAPRVPEAVPACTPSQATTSVGRLRLAVPRSTGATPDESGYDPLAAYLARTLDLPVDLVVTRTYEELVEDLLGGGVEVAILPPLSYVRVHDRNPCIVPSLTLVREGQVHYSSYILVHKDRDIHGVDQLRGKRIAFMDRVSASGYMFPVIHLLDRGIDPDRDLAGVRFFEDHLAILRAVVSGEVDAGASYGGAVASARRKGSLDTGSLRVLAITGRIPYDAIVLRPDLDGALAARIVRVFEGLNTTTAEGRRVLAPLSDVSGFVPTDDGFYDPVRQRLRDLRARGKEVP